MLFKSPIPYLSGRQVLPTGRQANPLRMVTISFFLCLLFSWKYSCAQEKKGDLGIAVVNQVPVQGIIVNGDTVEYSMKNNEVTAQGNVSVDYKGTKLTCHKLTVNTQTKQATAEDHVQVEDKQGIISGDRIIYDFNTGSGKIIDAHFVSEPFFGEARRMEKISDTELAGFDGYATSCSLDHAHYRIKSENIRIFPGEKIMTKRDTLFLGPAPILYLPRYDHSLKDPMMHIQLSPGSRKGWGPYLLSATRYSITDNISGRIYLDYRSKLGVAEGFGTNYLTEKFGKGDFKFYYSHEKDTNLSVNNTPAPEFERYLIRWRHVWQIDQKTNLISEYYKITDSKRALRGIDYNILKDYFYREYEKDSQPLSYTLLHHNFNNSGLDVLVQKRTNRWYTQLEKLPEVKYSLPSIQIGESPFYFENNSSAANFNYKHAVPSPSQDDISLFRLDTTNKISLPTKVAFIQFTPFVASRQTFYDKDVNDSSLAPRTVFYTGADFSSKFYRTFDVKSNFLGLGIHGLRHIITPTIGYAYNHEPTVKSSRLKQIDSVDSITRSNVATLVLSNKLQTKRNNIAVDMADFKINTSYVFKPKAATKPGSNFSDFLFDLKLIPNAWLRVDADATYKHSGVRSDANYGRFSEANYDINLNFGNGRSIGLGERYQRKGGKEITFNSNWRLSPKWRFGIYERYQFHSYANGKRGLKEQQYTIARDLHCWELDMTYDIQKEHGHTIYFIFRLKAFPEIEFSFDQNYHAPKSGTNK